MWLKINELDYDIESIFFSRDRSNQAKVPSIKGYKNTVINFIVYFGNEWYNIFLNHKQFGKEEYWLFFPLIGVIVICC